MVADNNKCNPLHYAVSARSSACVNLLLTKIAEQKIEVKEWLVQDSTCGETPLHIALRVCDFISTCALIAAVGSPLVQQALCKKTWEYPGGKHKGSTALHYAALWSNSRGVRLVLKVLPDDEAKFDLCSRVDASEETALQKTFQIHYHSDHVNCYKKEMALRKFMPELADKQSDGNELEQTKKCVIC